MVSRNSGKWRSSPVASECEAHRATPRRYFAPDMLRLSRFLWSVPSVSVISSLLVSFHPCRVSFLYLAGLRRSPNAAVPGNVRGGVADPPRQRWRVCPVLYVRICVSGGASRGGFCVLLTARTQFRVRVISIPYFPIAEDISVSVFRDSRAISQSPLCSGIKMKRESGGCVWVGVGVGWGGFFFLPGSCKTPHPAKHISVLLGLPLSRTTISLAP